MTKLGQMLVDDGYKRGKIQGALLCGKTPEEVAEMFDILLQEVLKVKENEKDMKKAWVIDLYLYTIYKREYSYVA